MAGRAKSRTVGGGMAAGDPRTAAAGTELLARGGNAVDAAVGATFAAFVAEPVLTGAFGGGFAIHAAPGEAARAFDFFAEVPGRGLEPAAAVKELDFVSVEVSFGPATQVFHLGRGSVATPLLLPGLVALHEEGGRLPLPDVLAPARALATGGVPLSAGVANILSILEPILRHTPEAAALFAPNGRLLGEGERFRADGIATLLDAVAEGDTAPAREALLSFFGPPAGRLTAADLDAARPVVHAPIALEVGEGHVVHLTPPPSSGGLLVAFGLRLLEGVPSRVWRDEIATVDHLVAALAVTAAAREEKLDAALEGDEDLADVAAAFLDDAHLDAWREPFARAVREGPGHLAPAPSPGPGSTTHVSAVDAEGRACAITTSNGEGCGHVVPGTGTLANNFLGEEDLHPGGFHRRPVGARLTSMMCPTLVARDGAPELVLGSGGSNRIRSAILEVLVPVLLAGRGLREAVLAPRLHLEGTTLYVEGRGPSGPMPRPVLEHLARRMADIVVFDAPSMFFGGVHAMARGGDGAGDPRRGGAVDHV